MRDRISIVRATTTNVGGNPVETTSTLFSRLPATVEDSYSARIERIFGERQTAIRPRIVTLMHQTSLDAVATSDHVLWHYGETDIRLDITGIVVEGQWRKRLLLLVEERS